MYYQIHVESVYRYLVSAGDWMHFFTIHRLSDCLGTIISIISDVRENVSPCWESLRYSSCESRRHFIRRCLTLVTWELGGCYLYFWEYLIIRSGKLERLQNCWIFWRKHYISCSFVGKGIDLVRVHRYGGDSGRFYKNLNLKCWNLK